MDVCDLLDLRFLEGGEAKGRALPPFASQAEIKQLYGFLPSKRDEKEVNVALDRNNSYFCFLDLDSVILWIESSSCYFCSAADATKEFQPEGET